MSPRILLAEADDSTRAFLTENLTADGYTIAPVSTGQAAVAELAHGDGTVDLLVIDVNGHTLQVVDAIRDPGHPPANIPGDLPIVVLTSDAEQLHRVRLLERGADDVVTKPVHYPELRARVAAVLRRAAPRQAAAVIVAGDLRIDLRQRRVTVCGDPVAISATEYRLLCALASDPERVFTRAELLAAVWGYDARSHTRTLDSHAHRLRRKLSAASHPVVVNVWGVGYQFQR